MDMKCLTVRQPWAWLLVNGHKDIENRSWKTKYRRPLMIHAAQQRAVDYAALIKELRRRHRIHIPADLPTGRIVGIVTIVDCVKKSRSRWFFGPVGFVCARARRLPFVPLKGRLGIFDIDPKIERRLKRRGK